MKVIVKQWHAVAYWKWDTGMEESEVDAEDDVCGICRVSFEGCCPTCKMPGDDCPLIWGECTHIFHMHCLLKWLTTPSSKQQCPMDRRPWVDSDHQFEYAVDLANLPDTWTVCISSSKIPRVIFAHEYGPRTASYKDGNIKTLSYLFDASYCFFPLSLERMWTLSRKDNLDARKTIFKNFAIMGKVLKPIGQYLVTQTDPAYPGKRAAPTFNYFGFRDNEPLKEVLKNVNAVEARYGANLPDTLKGAFVALRNCTEMYLDGR